MSENSAIEWCDATWNPVLGCSKVSEGCRGCYAILQAWMKQSNRNEKVREAYAGLVEKRPDGSLNWTGKVNTIFDRLGDPLGWKKPKRIFVNSLSDLFHDAVPVEFIALVWATMALAEQHTFQVLTKRPDRMRRVVGDPTFEALVKEAMDDEYDAIPAGRWEWPLPNVWLGTSVENQKAADERIPHLLRTPAAVRFLSCEPLLGPVNLLPWMTKFCDRDAGDCAWLKDRYRCEGCMLKPEHQVLHWVIAGGESGPKARPMHPDWARSLRDQCQAAGVAFHFKQWGEWAAYDQDAQTPFWRSASDGSLIDGHVFPDTISDGKAVNGWLADMDPDHSPVVYRRVGKRASGRLLDGRTWDEFPRSAVLP